MRKILLIFTMCFALWGNAMAQQTVTGTVTGEDGISIPGVAVVEKGTNNGTVTSMDGIYTINVTSGAAVLVYSFVGMLTIEEPVNNRTTIPVTLKVDAVGIDEVVVTALGIKREKKALGYSVSEVDGEELTRAASVNPINALQGKVAGVQINTTAGGVFGNSRITIRGNATFDQNTQPIFVVDGVIMDNDIGGSWGNQLKNLNADDFESFSVLKGAAATALYGSRALNGVVLITTKEGKKRTGLGVSVNQTTGIRYVYDEPAFQNQYGYGGVAGLFSNDQTNGRPDKDSHDNQQFTYYDPITKLPSLQHDNSEENAASWGPRFDGQEYIDYDGSRAKWVAQPDNYKKMFDTGILNNTNVAIEGGGESNSFRMSYSNFKESGVQPLNEFKKNSFSLKGTQDLLKNIIKIGGNVHFTRSEAANPPKGIMQDGWFHDGFPRSYDPDKWRNTYKDVDGGVPYPTGSGNYMYTKKSQSWFTLYENHEKRTEGSLLVNGDLDINIAKGVSAKISGNINQFTFKGEEKGAATTQDRISNARYFLSHGERFQSSVTATMAWVKELNDDFSFDLLVGAESWTSKTSSSGSSTNRGFKVRDFYNINNSFDSPTFAGGIGFQKSINSVYSFLNVNYKSALFLSLTGRNDWSSALVYPNGTGDNSYFYPSVGLSWLVSESFVLPEFISFAKLRGSYAIVGNDTEPYSLSSGFSPVVFSQAPTLNMYRFQNNIAVSPNLRPEMKHSIETGIDVRFFKGRVGLDLAYYKDNTYDQIIALGVPNESGIGSQLINAGNLQNQGVEVMLNLVPVRTKDFTWEIGVTATHNRDKVIELHPGVNEIILDGNPGDANAGMATIAYAGGDYGMLATRRGYVYYADPTNANNPNNGMPVLYQRNNWSVAYPNGNSNQDSLHIVGNMQPDLYGGITTSLRYKRFKLDALFDMRFGGEIYSNAYRYGLHQGVLESSLPNRDKEQGGIEWVSQGMGSNYFGKTYQDGYIPEGVFPSGTTINYKGADNVVSKTVNVGGMSYQQAYDAGLVEPTHWSGYIYRWTSASTGTSLMGVHELNWVGLRELSLSYDVPASLLAKIFVESASFTVTARDIGFLYNSMPDNINPVISDNKAGSALQMGFDPYVRSVNFALKLNF